MNRLQMLCRRALCVPIRIYQYTLSPWIGRSCRFSPSCSNYTMQAILTHGCVKGILLGAWRIARCNPLGRWGYDPVPPPGRWQSPARNLQPAKLFYTRHKRKVEK
ncbi:membrane protein insertion efficiency factor YidD [Faecalibacterium prausnitzii]|uniref:membrane protein insertion efficiency factor YidD n=1 Tax=Faecalibacterium prausnitzii TaxID=853 RepID=UPI0029139817|nr:membrane protein insertion efficiency factor YidD [Faecalibacterium prausnitzii]MDU8657365.1 membrane protein insertion efficiency factor YidD [Faecalibacterium prausnitzii]